MCIRDSYGFDSFVTVIPNEQTQAINTYSHIGSLLPDIISGTHVTPLQSTHQQDISGTHGTLTNARFAQAKINLINKIIENGPSILIQSGLYKLPNDTTITGYDSGYLTLSAKNLSPLHIATTFRIVDHYSASTTFVGSTSTIQNISYISCDFANAAMLHSLVTGHGVESNTIIVNFVPDTSLTLNKTVTTTETNIDITLTKFSNNIIPVVGGHSEYHSFGILTSKPIYYSHGFTDFISFAPPVTDIGVPSGSMIYHINYIYNSTRLPTTRTGIITITVDISRNNISTSDSYDYCGNEDYSTVLRFKAKLLSVYGDSLFAQDGEFVAGREYVITHLGTTPSDWNYIAGTFGLSYSIGDVFTAVTNGSLIRGDGIGGLSNTAGYSIMLQYKNEMTSLQTLLDVNVNTNPQSAVDMFSYSITAIS